MFYILHHVYNAALWFISLSCAISDLRLFIRYSKMGKLPSLRNDEASGYMTEKLRPVGFPQERKKTSKPEARNPKLQSRSRRSRSHSSFQAFGKLSASKPKIKSTALRALQLYLQNLVIVARSEVGIVLWRSVNRLQYGGFQVRQGHRFKKRNWTIIRN